MRAVFSLLALVVVLAVVYTLARRQSPMAGPPVVGGVVRPDSTAATAATPATTRAAPEKVRQDVQDALQNAAQRQASAAAGD